jgi:hypothetical protein
MDKILFVKTFNQKPVYTDKLASFTGLPAAFPGKPTDFAGKTTENKISSYRSNTVGSRQSTKRNPELAK